MQLGGTTSSHPIESPKEFSREEHILIPVRIQYGPRSVETFALLDSGATSSFISNDSLERNQIPCQNITQRETISAVDRHPLYLTKDTQVMELTIGHHTEEIKLNALNIKSYPIILGIDWLKKPNPTINWNCHLVTFSLEYCTLNCLSATNQVRTLLHHPRSSPSHGVIGQALAHAQSPVHAQVPAHAQVPEPS